MKTYQWNEELKQMTTRSALDDLYREIQLMRQFNHENVVSLNDVLDDRGEDKIYFITEYMKNGECMRFDSVRRRFTSPITKTVLPETLARRHISDILHGIRYLHNMDVAHRDLKPHNILLDSSFRCRITDFGCAIYKPEEGALVSDTCGTYHFFSPECCSGDPYDPFLGDMWAVGIILYIFVYGKLPFEAEHTGILFEKITQHEVTINPCSLSVLGVDFLTKLIEKDPSKRMSATQALCHPWISKCAHDAANA
ncbi:unnamed protein product [Albugo candida]|nr:unnamed protein product [Albugo candida]|eukprot:CCI45837.1 unnamed protein product [Albugo candida]